MNLIVVLGRICFTLIFFLSFMGHFTDQAIGYAAAYGVPMPSVFVPLSGLIVFAGALSILLGYKARIGAWLIVIFLVPVTLFMHRFWGVPDPMAAQMQKIMFLKNLSMLGAALMLAYFGSGPWSLSKK